MAVAQRTGFHIKSYIRLRPWTGRPDRLLRKHQTCTIVTKWRQPWLLLPCSPCRQGVPAGALGANQPLLSCAAAPAGPGRQPLGGQWHRHPPCRQVGADANAEHDVRHGRGVHTRHDDWPDTGRGRPHDGGAGGVAGGRAGWLRLGDGQAILDSGSWPGTEMRGPGSWILSRN